MTTPISGRPGNALPSVGSPAASDTAPAERGGGGAASSVPPLPPRALTTPDVLNLVTGYLPPGDVAALATTSKEMGKEVTSDRLTSGMLAAQPRDAPWRDEAKKQIASLTARYQELYDRYWGPQRGDLTFDELTKVHAELETRTQELSRNYGAVTANAARLGRTVAPMEDLLTAEGIVSLFPRKFKDILIASGLPLQTRMQQACELVDSMKAHFNAYASYGKTVDISYFPVDLKDRISLWAAFGGMKAAPPPALIQSFVDQLHKALSDCTPDRSVRQFDFRNFWSTVGGSRYQLEVFADNFKNVLMASSIPLPVKLQEAWELVHNVTSHLNYLHSNGENAVVDWNLQNLQPMDRISLEETLRGMLKIEPQDSILHPFLVQLQNDLNGSVSA